MQFGGKTNKVGYFSVTYGVTIDGVQYTPQVCYRLADDIREVVDGLVKKNLAVIYDEEVRFISGVAVPIRKDIPQVSSSATNDLAVKPKRGRRRDFN
jgi:hypothetical protein